MQTPPTSASGQRSGVATPHGAKRILVVEDDGAMARVVCDNLAIEGFDVRHAASGDEAVRTAAKFHPDLRAVLRRARADVERLVLGDVTIDLQSQRATTGEHTVALTHRECELLRYLAERRDRVVHRDALLREVWGYQETPLTRSVDSAVARLRKKVEPDPHHPLFIHTVHGDGYCLTSTACDGDAWGAAPLIR